MDEEADEPRKRHALPTAPTVHWYSSTTQSSPSAFSHSRSLQSSRSSESRSSGWSAINSKPRGRFNSYRRPTGLAVQAIDSGSQVRSSCPTLSTTQPSPSTPVHPQTLLNSLFGSKTSRSDYSDRETRFRPRYSPSRITRPRSRELRVSTASDGATSQPSVVETIVVKSPGAREHGGSGHEDRDGLKDEDYEDLSIKPSLKRKGQKIATQTGQRKKARSDHHKSSDQPMPEMCQQTRLSRSMTRAKGLEAAKSMGLGQHLGWTRGSVMTYQSVTDDSMHWAVAAPHQPLHTAGTGPHQKDTSTGTVNTAVSQPSSGLRVQEQRRRTMPQVHGSERPLRAMPLVQQPAMTFGDRATAQSMRRRGHATSVGQRQSRSGRRDWGDLGGQECQGGLRRVLRPWEL